MVIEQTLYRVACAWTDRKLFGDIGFYGSIEVVIIDGFIYELFGRTFVADDSIALIAHSLIAYLPLVSLLSQCPTEVAR